MQYNGNDLIEYEVSSWKDASILPAEKTLETHKGTDKHKHLGPNGEGLYQFAFKKDIKDLNEKPKTYSDLIDPAAKYTGISSKILNRLYQFASGCNHDAGEKIKQLGYQKSDLVYRIVYCESDNSDLENWVHNQFMIEYGFQNLYEDIPPTIATKPNTKSRKKDPIDKYVLMINDLPLESRKLVLERAYDQLKNDIVSEYLGGSPLLS